MNDTLKVVRKRPKRLMHSARTIRGKVERFIRKNMSINQLQKLYDPLTEKEKLQFLTELLPYVLARPSAGQDMDLNLLSDQQLDQMMERAEAAAQRAAGWS